VLSGNNAKKHGEYVKADDATETKTDLWGRLFLRPIEEPTKVTIFSKAEFEMVRRYI
jgi:hypothetical protein